MTTQEYYDHLRTQRKRDDSVIALAVDSPAIINAMPDVIRAWHPGAHAIGDVREHDGIPYKCVQGHDSTANPTWTPPTVPALWMQYHGTSAATARPYIQPQGAHDAYQVGEYCTEGDAIYRCKTAATVYPPSVLPASWERVEA